MDNAFFSPSFYALTGKDEIRGGSEQFAFDFQYPFVNSEILNSSSSSKRYLHLMVELSPAVAGQIFLTVSIRTPLNISAF